MSEQTCPKCDGHMARGFIPDAGHGQVFIAGWHEGVPRKALVRKTKVDLRQGIPIAAFKCSECGYLEMYADPSFGAL